MWRATGVVMRRVLLAVGLCLAVALLPSTAWAAPGDDLAGLTATASSNYSGYGPANAVDNGGSAFPWLSSAAPVVGQWLQIDAGSSKPVQSYRLTTQSQTNRSPGGWTLAGSDSSSGPWTTVLDTRTGVAISGSSSTVYTLASVETFRYWRFTITEAVAGADSLVGWQEVDLIEGTPAPPTTTTTTSASPTSSATSSPSSSSSSSSPSVPAGSAMGPCTEAEWSSSCGAWTPGAVASIVFCAGVVAFCLMVVVVGHVFGTAGRG